MARNVIERLLLSLACGTIGCVEPTAVVARGFPRSNVTPWVAARAAQSLDADGHFVFRPATDASGPATISGERAVQLATAYWHRLAAGPHGSPSQTIGSATLGLASDDLEAEHGRPIDWSGAAPAPWSPYFSESPALPLPDSVSLGFRRAVGPRYHVLIVSGGTIAADIAVSAYATDVETSADGSAIVGGDPSGLFVLAGIPVQFGQDVPEIPEEAVRTVALATGARITEPPRLVGPWDHWSPVFARWLLHLDRRVPVRLESTGEQVETDEILVGLGGGAPSTRSWYIAAPSQLEGDTWPALDAEQRPILLTMPLRSDLPNRVLLVTP